MYLLYFSTLLLFLFFITTADLYGYSWFLRINSTGGLLKKLRL